MPQNITYKMNIPTNVPNSTLVYKIQKPKIIEKDVLQIAMTLGLKGSLEKGNLQKVDNWIIYDERNFSVKMNKISGAISYRNNMRYCLDEGIEFKKTDNEAKDIAIKFIDENNLADVNMLKLLKVSHLHTGSCKKDGSDLEERIIDAGVIFGREIDGINVDGPGGKIMINIAPDGEVVGFKKIWREIKREIRHVAIRKPKIIEEKFKKKISHIIGDVTVKKSNFCYFEGGANFPQRFFQPSYILVYETKMPVNTVPRLNYTYKSVKVISGSSTKFEKFYKNKIIRGYSDTR